METSGVSFTESDACTAVELRSTTTAVRKVDMVFACWVRGWKRCTTPSCQQKEQRASPRHKTSRKKYQQLFHHHLLHTTRHTFLLQTPPPQGQHTPWQTRPSTSNSLNSWPSTLPANSSSRTSSTPSRRTSTARRACTSLARAQLCGGSTPTRSPLPPLQRPLAMHHLPPPCPWTIRTECSLSRAPPLSNSSSFSTSTAMELAARSEVK